MTTPLSLSVADSNKIRVAGNSGVNLADSAMLLFTRPNTTASPNGAFGIRCDVGAYIDGPIGGLAGKVVLSSEQPCTEVLALSRRSVYRELLRLTALLGGGEAPPLRPVTLERQ